jgi:hypothetical protein
MEERRNAERVRLNLRARWETLTAQGRGSVCDLSSTGCFVLSGGRVDDGQLVRLEIYFPAGLASLWGTVVYSVAEMGFAVRFKFPGDKEKREFERLIVSVS